MAYCKEYGNKRKAGKNFLCKTCREQTGASNKSTNSTTSIQSTDGMNEYVSASEIPSADAAFWEQMSNLFGVKLKRLE